MKPTELAERFRAIEAERNRILQLLKDLGFSVKYENGTYFFERTTKEII